ncbi:uncharacterized protein LOC141656157 [Silene latifolia]|uniref:uncharacterized protein LOC141656157 n=1 Tax=Silene latifolia TaxID=37657 RepID=UPI003D787A9C
MMLGMMNKLQVTLSEHMMRVNRCLSDSEIDRLKGMEAIYESNQGKLLARSDEDGTLILAEYIDNGIIPEHAMFKAPYTNPVDIRKKSIGGILNLVESVDNVPEFSMLRLNPMGMSQSSLVDILALKILKFPAQRGNMKVSKELSSFLWPLDQDVIQVQFRSPVPQLPPLGQLKAVFSNTESSSSSEYCLAACNDGTVKWRLESECENKGHIWTVHLFERQRGEEVNLSQKLKRRVPIALNNNFLNVINNNNIGGNSNGSGEQTIGDITAQSVINLFLPKTNI